MINVEGEPVYENGNSIRLYNLDLTNFCYYMTYYMHAKYKKDPMSFLEVNEQDAEHITARITEFLSAYLKRSGRKGYVIGLSGGIDSSVSAALAVKAVGKENVYGMLLPSKFTAQNHIDDALELATMLGIRTNNYQKVKRHFDKAVGMTMNMTGVKKNNPKFKLILGNNHARERMKILRGKAEELGYLVLGTTNMTEDWLGYATIAGDGYKGVDIEPIKMLPKTSEKSYAKFFNIPEQIIIKPPTAGLWEGQTDEGEIGMTYEDIDRIMAGYFIGRIYITENMDCKVNIGTLNPYEMLYDKDKNEGYKTCLTVEDIVRANNKKAITKDSIERIVKWAEKNSFKAKPEPFADLTRKWYMELEGERTRKNGLPIIINARLVLKHDKS